jgi:hypothetical protein
MTHTETSDFLDSVGETATRATMLGVLAITGMLFLPIAAPLIACGLIYAAVKPRAQEVEPEYKVVE